MKPLTVVVALAFAPLAVQAPISAQDPAFDVVSVKSDANPAAQIGIRPVFGNRFSAVITVKLLIAVAYGERSTLLDSQVVGTPSWAATDRYEINATFDGPMGTAAAEGSPDRLMSMVRRMLADRFKLRIHKEIRETPVYDLVVASTDGRLGPRLTKPPGTCVRVSGPLPANFDFSTSCGFKRVGPTLIMAKSIHLDSFATQLSRGADVGRLVRNRTALIDEFDIEFEYVPLAAAAADPQAGPGLTTALRDQLGLALRPATGPMDVFVVDGLERPTPD